MEKVMKEVRSSFERIYCDNRDKKCVWFYTEEAYNTTWTVTDYLIPTDMVYDKRTLVVYYEVRDNEKVVSRHPYLNENGKHCRFLEINGYGYAGEFVEIS